MIQIQKPDKPKWSGPYTGGITQSILNKFLVCPKRFYLYYVCGLKERKPLDVNLIWGDVLHKGLEHILRGEPFDVANNAMQEYLIFKYPYAPSSYSGTTKEMLKCYPSQKTIDEWGGIETEVELDETVTLPGYRLFIRDNYYDYCPPRVVRMRGKVDMLNRSIRKFGDHKCKGKLYALETREELCQDMQMNIYAKLLGDLENWQYDLIQVPEAAYRVPDKYGTETAAVYADRIFYKYKNTAYGFPIYDHLPQHLMQIPHYQSVSDIDTFWNHTVYPAMWRLCHFWDYVTHPDFDPNDPRCHNPDFYQMPVRFFDASRTGKFKGDFHALMVDQIPIESLVPVEAFYSELADEQ